MYVFLFKKVFQSSKQSLLCVFLAYFSQLLLLGWDYFPTMLLVSTDQIKINHINMCLLSENVPGHIIM